MFQVNTDKGVKPMKKFFNITSIALEMICEIVLLPFHIVKAMINIAEELNK